MTSFFQRLRNIEAQAALTTQALGLYQEGAWSHRVLTARLERLRADWRQVEQERRAALQEAQDSQLSPQGFSPADVA